jgi:hypothetical protein
MLISTITALSITTAFNSPLMLPISAPHEPIESKSSLELVIQDYIKDSKEPRPLKLNTTEKITEQNVEKVWKCKGCNQTEAYTLEYLQKQGIKDKNALATIMGNIKQESDFIPNICEGGAITRYESCGAGYGLIQWTSSDRYYRLGSVARSSGFSPSSLEGQLKHMLTEPQWKEIEYQMKSPGKSIDSYMNVAYRWIGWGIHGARTNFAYRYANKMYMEG